MSRKRVRLCVFVLFLAAAVGAQAASVEVRPVRSGFSPGEPDWMLTERRCSTPEIDAVTRAWLEDLREQLHHEDQLLGESAQRTAVIRVPVNFFVVMKPSGKGEITQAQINAQVEVMNDFYSKAGFRFVVGQGWLITKNRWYSKCLQTKKSGKWNPVYKKMTKFVNREIGLDSARSLNVFTCDPQRTTIGQAFYPWALPEGDYRDAIVIDYRTLPGGSYQNYNAGLTLVHEAGHYFGELHTFANGCQAPGDYINDTPYEASPAYEAVPENNCAKGRNTCPQKGKDPVWNPMDYSSDYCMTRFSKGQRKDMKLLVREFRPALLKN